jgi:hypothetical protein
MRWRVAARRGIRQTSFLTCDLYRRGGRGGEIRYELDREGISGFVEKLEEGTTSAQCRVQFMPFRENLGVVAWISRCDVISGVVVYGSSGVLLRAINPQ